MPPLPPGPAPRCPVEGALAAYALRALPAEEAAEVEAHLRDCPGCRTALEEFRGLPALLDLLDPAEVVAGPPVPRLDQLDRLLSAAGRERRTHRYRRLAAVAAAVVLVAAGAGWVVGRETAPGERAGPTQAAAGNSHLNAQVTMADSAAGTQVTLRLSGISGRLDCRLVAVAKDGKREVAASWNVESDGVAVIEGNTGIPRAQLSTFDIVTPAGQTLMTMPVDPS
nr:zf-HC2 domain-containing protein [Motilibacter aurantiacus]